MGTRMAIVVRAPASVYNIYDGVIGTIPVCHLLKFIPERNTLCLHWWKQKHNSIKSMSHSYLVTKLLCLHRSRIKEWFYFVISLHAEGKTIHITTSKMSKPELTCSVLYPASLPGARKSLRFFECLGTRLTPCQYSVEGQSVGFDVCVSILLPASDRHQHL